MLSVGFADTYAGELKKGNVMGIRKYKPRGKMVYGKSQIPAVVENATPEQRRSLMRRLTSRNSGKIEGQIEMGTSKIEFLESSETQVSH